MASKVKTGKGSVSANSERIRTLSGPITTYKWKGKTLQERLTEFTEIPNLAADMPDTALLFYGTQLMELYEIDMASRSDWEKAAEMGLNLVEELEDEASEGTDRQGDEHVAKPKHPLLVQAIMEFAARAYPALLSDPILVKTLPITKDKAGDLAEVEAVGKIAYALSSQVRVYEPNWEFDTDRMLHHMAVTGMAFRKRYHDPIKGMLCSQFVSAFDVVVNNKTESMETAPRISHRFYNYPHEIRALMQEGYFHKVQLNQESDHMDPDREVELIEMQCWLPIFDKETVEVPCIVTVHRKTKRIIRFIAGYAASDFTLGENEQFVHFRRLQFFTDYHFIPDFKGNFYSYGYGKLLGQLNQSINDVLRSIIKSADNYTKNGGVIGTGGQLESEEIELRSDRLKSVPVDIGNLKDQILLLPVKPPSQVLFSVLGLLTEAGQRLSSTVDLTQSASTMAATTTAAIVEQGQRLYSSIYKRTYSAMGREFTLMHRQIKLYLRGGMAYIIDGKEGTVDNNVLASDVQVLLTADPNITSDIQKQTLVQVYMQFLEAPNVNVEELLKRIFVLMGVPQYEQIILPTPNEPPIEMQIAMREIELKMMEQARKGAETEARIRLLSAQAIGEIEGAMTAASQRDNEGIKLQLDRARLALDALSKLKEPPKLIGAGGGDTAPKLPPAPNLDQGMSQLQNIDETMAQGNPGFGE